MDENEISGYLMKAVIEVHKTLGGPGLLESIYEEALSWELTQCGLDVKRQAMQPINYKGNQLAVPLQIDLFINDKVVVECKAVSEYNKIFEVQTLTYLRLGGYKLGIVINFGSALVKDGFHRVVNHL